MMDEPTESGLRLLARLEAEQAPLEPQDPELAERIASDADARSLAAALSVSRRALDAAEEPDESRFESLTDAVMAELTSESSRRAPLEAADVGEGSWRQRLREWFRAVADSMRPRHVALAGALLVIFGLGLWLLMRPSDVDQGNFDGANETSGKPEGPGAVAVDSDAVDDEGERHSTGAGASGGVGEANLAVGSDDVVAELDEALSARHFGSLGEIAVMDQEIEPVELVATWDETSWAASDGFGDYGLEGMSSDELEALDEALADL